jgi:two-component system heavy metal sensor histidine kinase CusS
MKFRSRVALFAIASTTVTLGLAFAGVAAAFNSLQQKQLDEAILEVALAEAEQAAAGDLVFSDMPGPAANAVGPFPKYGIIYDGDGTIVAKTDAFAAEPPSLDARTQRLGKFFDFTSGDTRLRAVVVDVKGRPHRLLLAAPREDIDDDEAFLVRGMIVAFVAATGWSTLLALALVQTITRGHDRIAAVAGRVASGDLTARIGDAAGGGEVGQLGRDVDGMIERLGAVIAAQHRFIAHAAHELKSPLSALHLELQHAERVAKDGRDVTEAIAGALASTRHLRTLAEDLLTLARAEARSAPAHDSCAVAQLLQLAAEPLRRRAEERGVTLHLGRAEAAVPGAPRDLTRLLRNLLQNAIDHAPQGGHVMVREERDGDHVLVVVDDDGPGVSEGDAARIFEPFYRGATERGAEGGSGLGLAIAREIAEAHGGAVVLGRKESAGARFVVRLPGATMLGETGPVP